MAQKDILGFQMKNAAFFFDSLVVIRSIEPGKRRAMSKIGSFVRTRSRSIIGGVTKKAKPRPRGKPPRARTTKKPNLKTILFALDRDTESVVIGPVKFNRVIVRDGYNPIGGTTIPEVQEFGGRVRVTEIWRRWNGKWQWLPIKMFRRRSSRQLRAGEKKRTIAKKYPPRPFMGPALQHELRNPKLIGAFQDIQGAGIIGPIAA